MVAKKSDSLGSGLGVDASGGQVVDPTENVKALSLAANKRQDDLREAFEKLVVAELDHVKQVSIIRSAHSHERDLLLKEVSEIRASNANEKDVLQAKFYEQLRDMESKFNDKIRELESNRLNAIRQVDVLAVNTAADRAAAALATLAVTTAANAENLRNALNTTATTIASQTADTVAAITGRLSALERSMYEGKGKETVSDPVMAALLVEVKNLREMRSSAEGVNRGIGISWGVVVAAVAFVSALTGIIGFLATKVT